jgi:hypothetical protein
MSILSAIRQQSSSIDDLAKLPQAMIMQMAQRKQIAAEMVAPILARKAEMIDAAVKTKAMQQGAPQTSVMEQIIAKNSQSEQPMVRDNMGIAQIPVPEPQYAGGGIIAFDDGGEVDEDDDESYEDYLDELQRARLESMIHKTYENDGAGSSVGIGYIEAMPKRSAEKEERPAKKGKVGIEDLTAYVLQKESGGRRYDKAGNLLTSPKGAEGEMQVMPYTARDPGFGITPARDRSPDEIARVGKEYISAMLDRYGDPKLAAIAYNMGPGATDKWLASGADIKKLPDETRNYIKGLAGGGIIAFANRGRVIDDFGNVIDEEEVKKPSRSLSKEAERFLKSKAGQGEVKPLTQPPSQKLRPSMIGSDANVYPGMSDLNYYNELKTALQKDPTYEPYKEEMDKLLKRNPDLLTTTQPATNIIGPLANVQRTASVAPAKTIAAVPPNYTPDEAGSPYMDGMPPAMANNINPNAAPEAAAAAPAMSPEDKMLAQMQEALSKREARLEESRKMDPYLSLLSAGLAIAGGTSPYALTNIGQGGAQGVGQFAALQRARASEEAGIGALQNKMYSSALTGALRRDLQQQTQAGRQATLDQNLQTAKNAFIEKRLKATGIDEIMLGNLRRKQALGKLSGDDVKMLEFYEKQRKNIEQEANRLYASSGSNRGVIKLD